MFLISIFNFSSLHIRKLFSVLLTLIILIYVFPVNYVRASEENIIDEYEFINLNLHPRDFTYTQNKYFWFLTYSQNYIARLNDNGEIDKFYVSNTPDRVVGGFHNDIWFTEYVANKIGHISQDGIISEYDLPSRGYPLEITAGPDGNIWFTEYIGNKVGKITPDGQITDYYVSYGPHGITTGPDGNIWYTVFDLSMIGRISPQGTVTEYMLPTSRSKPENIIAGRDGNLWFTESASNKIGKITVNGKVTEYSIPTPDSHPFDIAAGQDGNIWFTELNGNNIGRITPDGIIDEFPIPSANSNTYSIIGGFDNKIWFAESAANKLGTIDLTKVPPPTVKPTAIPTIVPTQKLVDFKQTDGRWGNDRLQNSSDCGTLYGFGCAVTSVADVFTSYGKLLFDDTSSINPGSLNNWLSQNNGFIACNIVWATASRAIHIGPPLISFRNAKSDWQYGAQLIDTALSQGNLPIVGVSRPTGSHYFVISEKLPDTDGKPDYKIVDPALYPFVENIPGNTGKALSEVYGGFDKVFQTVIYDKETTPQKTLTARAHSPVQLLITDPNGIQTGYDESGQQIKEEIPDSVYGIEPGVAPVTGEIPAGDETKYFQQINPADGDYTIQVIGTGNGSYTLDFTLDDEEGNSKVYVIKGYAQKGITEKYVIHNIPGSDQPFTISKEVTYEVLLADLKKLYNQKQIKNKAFYQLLHAQVVLAEKTSLLRNQVIGNKLAIVTLQAMLYEITKAKDTLLTKDAKTILTLDIQTLLGILTQNEGGGSGGGS